MFEGSAEAIAHITRPDVLLLLMLATFLGIVASVIPGLSPAKVMALAIPFTFGMDQYQAFTFLAALVAAGGFAGSVTSILLGVPGDGVNAATVLDGHPMAKQGRAAEAIGASAAASALGAIIGVVVLVMMIPVVRELILMFGPPEFFALAMAGVLLIATVSAQAPLKGVIAGLIGMTLGFVGVNFTVGGIRYTFGIPQLEDGMRLVPALLGLFALPVLFDLMRRDSSVVRTGFKVEGWSGVMRGVLAVLKRPVLLIRSSLTGTLIGIVPGVGGSVASWVAYFGAASFSKDSQSFGKGNIEGVIAPEAANDSKDGGAMLSVLALGIPASVSTAVLLGAFLIHGVFPGRRLFEQQMDLIWVMILAMIVCNVLTSIWGLVFVSWLVKLTLVPATVLVPVILVLSMFGAYADQAALFGFVLLIFFSIIGIITGRLGYPAPPLLVGLILLPIAEENFHRATQITRGELTWLFRPLTLLIFGLALLGLFYRPLRNFAADLFQRRFAQPGRPAAAHRSTTSDPEELVGKPPPAAIPTIGQVVFPVAIILLALGAMLLATGFPARAAQFPFIVLTLLIALCALQLGLVIRRRMAAGVGILSFAGPREADVVRPAWFIVGVFLILPVLAILIGLLPAAFLYITAFILIVGQRRLTLKRSAIAFGLGGGMTALLYFVFVQGLALRFPAPLLF